jgi:hypothetical protein
MCAGLMAGGYFDAGVRLEFLVIVISVSFTFVVSSKELGDGVEACYRTLGRLWNGRPHVFEHPPAW